MNGLRQPPHVLRRARQMCCRTIALVVLWQAAALPARSQTIWEVSPYRIEVWVALEASPRVDLAWRQQLPEQLERLAENRVGAAWQLQARIAPQEFWGDMWRESTLDIEQLKAQQKELVMRDKLVLLLVQDDPAGYRLAAREVDLATRHGSPPQYVTIADGSRLAQQSLELICDVFVPLVRIERVEESTVTATVRGGALVRPEESRRRWRLPTQIDVGDVLQPLLMRIGRSGQVGPEGVKLVDWTVLVVTQCTGSRLTCTFYSGYRQPFSTRRSSRLQQLAYVVKPRLESSTLKLVDRRAPDSPLVGYEVYSRPPSAQEQKEQSNLIGRTDWRGELTIARDPQQPVQLLFIRNGQQLLAKLPVVPGDEPQWVAPLRNDDLRLEAEGFLLGVQDSLVDLVARREVLAARIRRAIEERQLDQADELLRQLRRLDTQEDFARRVEQRKQMLTSVDAQVQQQIDELFAQTRSLLGKYLNQAQVDELNRSLQAARQAAQAGG